MPSGVRVHTTFSDYPHYGSCSAKDQCTTMRKGNTIEQPLLVCQLQWIVASCVLDNYSPEICRLWYPWWSWCIPEYLFFLLLFGYHYAWTIRIAGISGFVHTICNCENRVNGGHPNHPEKRSWTWPWNNKIWSTSLMDSSANFLLYSWYSFWLRSITFKFDISMT